MLAKSVGALLASPSPPMEFEKQYFEQVSGA